MEVKDWREARGAPFCTPDTAPRRFALRPTMHSPCVRGTSRAAKASRKRSTVRSLGFRMLLSKLARIPEAQKPRIPEAQKPSSPAAQQPSSPEAQKPRSQVFGRSQCQRICTWASMPCRNLPQPRIGLESKPCQSLPKSANAHSQVTELNVAHVKLGVWKQAETAGTWGLLFFLRRLLPLCRLEIRGKAHFCILYTLRSGAELFGGAPSEQSAWEPRGARSVHMRRICGACRAPQCAALRICEFELRMPRVSAGEVGLELDDEVSSAGLRRRGEAATRSWKLVAGKVFSYILKSALHPHEYVLSFASCSFWSSSLPPCCIRCCHALFLTPLQLRPCWLSRGFSDSGPCLQPLRLACFSAWALYVNGKFRVICASKSASWMPLFFTCPSPIQFLEVSAPITEPRDHVRPGSAWIARHQDATQALISAAVPTR